MTESPWRRRRHACPGLRPDDSSITSLDERIVPTWRLAYGRNLSLGAAGFEAIITFGLVLVVLNLANGPKLNGPFVPLAVGAYIMAWGTMGGPHDGASMNPAHSFGPDLGLGQLYTLWVYLLGPVAVAVIAVGAAQVLRGPAKAQEASAAQGTPLDRDA